MKGFITICEVRHDRAFYLFTPQNYARRRDLRWCGAGQILRVLEAELSLATVVTSEELPRDVISVRLRALVALGGEEVEIALVYPDEANWSAGNLSILSPIGTALICYRAGDVANWHTSAALSALK